MLSLAEDVGSDRRPAGRTQRLSSPVQGPSHTLPFTHPSSALHLFASVCLYTVVPPDPRLHSPSFQLLPVHPAENIQRKNSRSNQFTRLPPGTILSSRCVAAYSIARLALTAPRTYSIRPPKCKSGEAGTRLALGICQGEARKCLL